MEFSEQKAKKLISEIDELFEEYGDDDEFGITPFLATVMSWVSYKQQQIEEATGEEFPLDRTFELMKEEFYP